MTKKPDNENGTTGGSTTDPQSALDYIYPDAAAAISFKPATIELMKENSIIFLDTNVLLLPYNTGKSSLVDIANIYAQLSNEKRLVVPSRVIQEFLKNSPNKIKETFQQLSRQQSFNVSTENYPLLESIEQYTDFLSARKKLTEQIKNYQKTLGKLIDVIRDWHHDDPIRRAYGEIFGPDQIEYLNTDAKSKFDKDHAYRNEHKIPPGYRDASKEDGGVGDLLIWKTILQVANRCKKHGIFVCGEEKPDWWHRSENKPLVVRHELIDEYRRESGGMTFRLLGMSDFLKLFGANEAVVEEVKEEQRTFAVTSQHRQSMVSHALHGVISWYITTYGGVVTSQHGKADFTAQSENGAVFVEVRVSQESDIHKLVVDVYVRSTARTGAAGIPQKSMLVLVAPDRDIAFMQTFEVQKWRGEIPNWHTFVCGYLGETGEFIDVYTG